MPCLARPALLSWPPLLSGEVVQGARESRDPGPATAHRARCPRGWRDPRPGKAGVTPAVWRGELTEGASGRCMQKETSLPNLFLPPVPQESGAHPGIENAWHY